MIVNRQFKFNIISTIIRVYVHKYVIPVYIGLYRSYYDIYCDDAYVQYTLENYYAKI